MSHKKITYHWGSDNVLIDLGSRIQPRIKVLFWSEFLFLTGWATIFLIKSFPLFSNALSTATAIGAMILYSVAAYRFMSRMFYREKILLSHQALDIIQRTPFMIKSNRYEWNMMGPLHYVGKSKKTDHHLKGYSYDYFGFETQEKLLHNLYTEGNISFIYEGFPVKFGKGVYSWNAEDIVNIMKLYVGERIKLGPEWEHMVQPFELDDSNSN